MKQGEIWYAALGPKGSEQDGLRPVLIVSGNLLNTYAPVVICVPLTTKIKNYKGNPVLEPSTTNGLNQTSEVLVSHIRSMSKERLFKKVGQLTPDIITSIRNTLDDLMTY